MKENPEDLQGEINVNEKTLLYSVKLLEDGSYIQSYANITELRKKEKELYAFKKGWSKWELGWRFGIKMIGLYTPIRTLEIFNKILVFN